MIYITWIVYLITNLHKFRTPDSKDAYKFSRLVLFTASARKMMWEVTGKIIYVVLFLIVSLSSCFSVSHIPFPFSLFAHPINIHVSVPIKKTPWSESASELYRPSDRRLSAKLLPAFADRGCHLVSVTDPYGRILDFLDRSRHFSIK
jgi:hypothetical protein